MPLGLKSLFWYKWATKRALKLVQCVKRSYKVDIVPDFSQHSLAFTLRIQDVTYLHTWPQKWRVIHHLFWDFLLLRADIRRQICVACQPGYSCHNALQYIRYVRGHIHFVSYITIGKRCIHKFFLLAEMKFCHVWGWKIPWPNLLRLLILGEIVFSWFL